MSLDRELKKRIDITIETWGKELIDAVAKALKDKGVTFSGGSESELIGSAELKVGLNDLSATLLMNDYWVFVDQGRPPTSKDGSGKVKKNLERWIKRKGIVPEAGSRTKKKIESLKNKKVRKAYKQITMEDRIKSFAFAIARKIHKEGYKGKFFIDEAITQRLVDSLSEQVLETIEDYTIEQINGN